MPKEARGKTGAPTETRNKATRPRDHLGRPLPWGAQGELQLEDYDAMSLEENHRLGTEHMRAGRYFPAHEAWETCWKQARDSHDAEFFKGLSQLGAGYVHLLRGNAHGAVRLLRRGAGRISAYPPDHRGIDTRGAATAAERMAQAVERGNVRPGQDVVIAGPVV